MRMQKRLRGLILSVAMMGMAFAAYADTMTVSTYYPSPYGSYQKLDTTDHTHLATGAGGVAIGTAVDATQKLQVVGGDILVDNNQALMFGGTNNYITGTEAADTLSIFTNNVERLHVSNTGDVGVGIAGPAYKLDVNGGLHVGGPAGNGTITITSGGNTGALQVAFSGGSYYAVYAP